MPPHRLLLEKPQVNQRTEYLDPTGAIDILVPFATLFARVPGRSNTASPASAKPPNTHLAAIRVSPTCSRSGAFANRASHRRRRTRRTGHVFFLLADTNAERDQRLERTVVRRPSRETGLLGRAQRDLRGGVRELLSPSRSSPFSGALVVLGHDHDRAAAVMGTFGAHRPEQQAGEVATPA